MKKSFPVGGVATLLKIDEFLDKAGVIAHNHCGLHGCKTTARYIWARNELLEILRFEANIKKKKGRVSISA